MSIESFYQEIYKDYTVKVLKNNKTPITEDVFTKLIIKLSESLIYMRQKSPEPYLAVDIDGSFVLYGEIKAGNIVINVWDKQQASHLLKK